MLKIGTKWEKNERLPHRHEYHNPDLIEFKLPNSNKIFGSNLS